MDLIIEGQKQQFIDICEKNIQRKGLQELLNWMTTRSDFFTAPASTKYHGAYAGGLCQHSLDVYDQAKKLVQTFSLKVSEDSLAIAALFHDICKANFYVVEKRNQKIDGVWKEVDVYAVDEKLAFGGHGSKSVYLTQYFMQLTPEEATAINCHMGFANETDANIRNISNAYKKYPLAWVIHVADEAATYLLGR